MHASALANAKHFFDHYAQPGTGRTVLDIGAQDVNGSLRSVAPAGCTYIGVDFVAAAGVDVVLTDPYSLPFDSGSVDIVVSSSCLEHAEMFWLLFLEMMRVLRPGGLLYLNVPSNGHYHRYPVDCWRFYPDSGRALANWARRNGMPAVCLESYVSDKMGSVWNDYVAVFAKDESCLHLHPRRIVHGTSAYTNGHVHGSAPHGAPGALLNARAAPEDQHHLLNALKCRFWIWRDKKRARRARRKARTPAATGTGTPGPG